MNVTGIIREIDAEIQKLQTVRSTLAGMSGEVTTSVPKTAMKARLRSPMSDEAKKRIGDAVRARHAANKKAAKK